MPSFIQNIIPKSKEDAICHTLYFDGSYMSKPESTVDKLSDFIEAHIPDGEGKCSITKMNLHLKNSSGDTISNADNILYKIFTRPEKFDLEHASFSGFPLSETTKSLIPDWIRPQKSLRCFDLENCAMGAERLSLILDVLAEKIIANPRVHHSFTFN